MINEYKSDNGSASINRLKGYSVRSRQRQAILSGGVEQLLSKMKNENK